MSWRCKSLSRPRLISTSSLWWAQVTPLKTSWSTFQKWVEVQNLGPSPCWGMHVCTTEAKSRIESSKPSALAHRSRPSASAVWYYPMQMLRSLEVNEEHVCAYCQHPAFLILISWSVTLAAATLHRSMWSAPPELWHQMNQRNLKPPSHNRETLWPPFIWLRVIDSTVFFWLNKHLILDSPQGSPA